MTQAKIHSAMVLAAGLGTRMRPLTLSLPKPLIAVAGRPLIAYGLEALERAGIGTVVVNVHYRADQLVSWLAENRPDAAISDERACLLESGGGIVHALPLLGDDPFIVLNADTFWIDDPGSRDNLSRLVEAYDPARMDMLMLTASPDRATGYEGRGDFVSDGEGRLDRYRGGGEPLIYAGALVVNPAIFGADRPPAFSLNVCFDEAIAAGRLFGLPLAGHWLTVGTPSAIGEAEAAIAALPHRAQS